MVKAPRVVPYGCKVSDVVPLTIQAFATNKETAQANGSQSKEDTTKRFGTTKMELLAEGVAEDRCMVHSNVCVAKNAEFHQYHKRATSVHCVEQKM